MKRSSDSADAAEPSSLRGRATPADVPTASCARLAAASFICTSFRARASSDRAAADSRRPRCDAAALQRSERRFRECVDRHVAREELFENAAKQKGTDCAEGGFVDG